MYQIITFRSLSVPWQHCNNTMTLALGYLLSRCWCHKHDCIMHQTIMCRSLSVLWQHCNNTMTLALGCCLVAICKLLHRKKVINFEALLFSRIKLIKMVYHIHVLIWYTLPGQRTLILCHNQMVAHWPEAILNNLWPTMTGIRWPKRLV